jgi:hypothetical protein
VSKQLNIFLSVTVADEADLEGTAEGVFNFLASDPDGLFPQIETVDNYGLHTRRHMKSKTIRRIRLGDNREIRLIRIPTGYGEDLIRVGINLVPEGTTMSGAVFPASYVGELIEALQVVQDG